MIKVQTPIETQEARFTQLYLEAFPAVARFIKQAGGDLTLARDIFQEALLAFYEQVEIGGREIQTSEKAYLMGISKRIFLKKREREMQTEGLEKVEMKEEYAPQPSEQKLLHHLQLAGQKCLDLLTAFYYEKLSMRHLASRFGFRTERSATVQKYKCLEKVRESIHQQSLNYEDFLD
jgi:DNA-directed RNA polymerase specialized sigma24 family protein